MNNLIVILFAVLVFEKVSAQQTVTVKEEVTTLKNIQPVAGKKFSVIYDASKGPLNATDPISATAIFYEYEKRPVTQKLTLKQERGLWTSTLNIPDSTLIVRLIFEDQQQKKIDSNNGNGYLLPVYKGNKPVQFAYAEIASLISEGPPDAYGLKKDHKKALASMKKEFISWPASEIRFRQRFYNMLANSPEREDKVELINRLSAMKSDKESDLMMAQLYLSYFGSKKQADSLDRLLVTKFPNGEYIKQQKLKAEENNKASKIEAVAAVSTVKSGKAPVDHAELIKNLNENRLKEPVAALTLKDLNGNDVVLGGDEMKGKIIVIDFWATWCKPCVRSFPAMQKVMEKYKDNPNVSFFYICTMEHGDALKNVKEFLSKNPLPFKILMDEKTTDMNLYKAFTHYKVDGGIPYKLVIDGKGNIRFRAVGFDGDEEKLIAELSAMIELAGS